MGRIRFFGIPSQYLGCDAKSPILAPCLWCSRIKRWCAPLLLAACLVLLFSCAPLTVKPQQVYYELGLGNADQIVVLAQAEPAGSTDFGLFFRTFSEEFENRWKQHCSEVRCLSNPWQITLTAAQAKMLFIHVDERSAGYPNFQVRKFSFQFPLQSIRNILVLAKRMVRTVIDSIFRSQRNPISFTAVSPAETPLRAAVEKEELGYGT